MVLKAEYKAIDAKTTTELNTKLSVAARDGWKPILLTMGGSIVVILEHTLGPLQKSNQ